MKNRNLNFYVWDSFRVLKLSRHTPTQAMAERKKSDDVISFDCSHNPFDPLFHHCNTTLNTLDADSCLCLDVLEHLLWNSLH